MQFCIYLRKSRADAEAEARGESETLARHQAALLDYAHHRKLHVAAIYREIVSGESIAARPAVQRLLTEVGQGLWTGVLVMEVERLARGDTIDQGIIAQTFKLTGTRIITPLKTYDPGNEFDEEYFEFGLFMSRREYKTINRRLQRGRLASVREGKYVASRPPYGYRKIKLEKEKGYTLAPIAGEADTVRRIFELYTLGERRAGGRIQRLGATLIARHLNALMIPPQRGMAWSPSSVRDILINPVYAGMLRWNWRPLSKKITDGIVTAGRPRSMEKCIVTAGLHEPLITRDMFDMAQKKMSERKPAAYGGRKKVKNPLCGLVFCGQCGRKMIRRPAPAGAGRPDILMCPDPSCSNVSSALPLAEDRILAALSFWLDGYTLDRDIWKPNHPDTQTAARKKALKKIEQELESLAVQMNKIHDLLEQRVYDVNEFRERKKKVSEKLRQARDSREELLAGFRPDEKEEIKIPAARRLMDVYSILPNPLAKNEILRELLEKAVYFKDKNGRWHSEPDAFEIVLYPKLPRNRG